jgi:ATP adenylyltransferase
MTIFETGSLWSKVVSQTGLATAKGKLQRIPTREETVEQDGIHFVVRLVDAVQRKRIARLMQPSDENPFLPYDEDLFVADVTDTHVCLLNKFNVVEHHLLIVTRCFEHQETLLTAADFEAMWSCLKEFDSLAFYNAGTIAGASQPHKHLQQVSAPLGAGPERTPMDAALRGAALDGSFGSVPELPFTHRVARLKDTTTLELREVAATNKELYDDMLRSVGCYDSEVPYNLLVTRDWMLLVPRGAEKYRSISVNSLGFAGSLLVRDEEELTLVREVGPMTILRSVGVEPVV